MSERLSRCVLERVEAWPVWRTAFVRHIASGLVDHRHQPPLVVDDKTYWDALLANIGARNTTLYVIEFAEHERCAVGCAAIYVSGAGIPKQFSLADLNPVFLRRHAPIADVVRDVAGRAALDEVLRWYPPKVQWAQPWRSVGAPFRERAA